MTSRERLIAATRRQPVDRVPCSVSFNPLYPVTRRGHSWNFPWRPDAAQEEKLRYQVEVLGLDQLVPAGITVTRVHPDVTCEVHLDGAILRKVWHTPAGDLRAAVRYNDLWPFGQEIPLFDDFNIGHFVEPWLKTEVDLACLKYVRQLALNRDTVHRAREEISRAKTLAGRWHLATSVHLYTSGLSGMMHLCGPERLCLMVVENPGLVQAYLEYDHGINMATIELAGEGGIDIVERNGFYETADFYSPRMLDAFLGRLLKEEAEAAHAGRMLAKYTVHTGVMPILDHLAALPFDAIFGIDIAFRNVSLEEVVRKLSGKCLWMGPSSTFHLWKGPDATRQAVRRVFEVVGKRGLVLSPAVSAHSIMPWESTLAMIGEWKRLR